MRKFEFNKSYKEVDIAGKVYKIRFDDEKLFEYHEAFEDFYKDTKGIKEIEADGMDNKELHKTYKEIREMSKTVLDIVLGEGAYEELYEKSGNSTLAMVDVINFVSDVVGEGMEDIRDRKQKDYIEKK